MDDTRFEEVKRETQEWREQVKKTDNIMVGLVFMKWLGIVQELIDALEEARG
jgi:hypothetical protein